MERLTFDGNFCNIAICSEVRGGTFCKDGACSQRKVWERLKAYEDTGLSPETVEALKLSMMGESIAEITEFNGLPIKRLRELAEADKDGRVVVLPCKVGDTVYQLRGKRHALGVGISPRTVSVALVWTNGDYALTHQGMDECCKRDLGKTWFLTREEAEEALKERKS